MRVQARCYKEEGRPEHASVNMFANPDEADELKAYFRRHGNSVHVYHRSVKAGGYVAQVWVVVAWPQEQTHG